MQRSPNRVRCWQGSLLHQHTEQRAQIDQVNLCFNLHVCFSLVHSYYFSANQRWRTKWRVLTFHLSLEKRKHVFVLSDFGTISHVECYCYLTSRMFTLRCLVEVKEKLSTIPFFHVKECFAMFFFFRNHPSFNLADNFWFDSLCLSGAWRWLSLLFPHWSSPRFKKYNFFTHHKPTFYQYYGV